MIRNPFTADCEETANAMSDLADDELGGWRRLRVVRHLTGCEHCQAIYRSLLRTLEALRGVRVPELEPRPTLADAVVRRIRRDSSPA